MPFASTDVLPRRRATPAELEEGEAQMRAAQERMASQARELGEQPLEDAKEEHVEASEGVVENLGGNVRVGSSETGKLAWIHYGGNLIAANSSPLSRDYIVNLWLIMVNLCLING